MKYLVTGAAGFIGYHLINAILERGDSVVGIDSINDYYDINLKFARLHEAGISQSASLWNESVQSSVYQTYRFVRMKLEDKDALQHIFEVERFDYVINLAAQAGVRYSIENPDAYIQSNIIGFFNILEACRFFPVKHLFYASSSSVYGFNEKVPFSENDNVDRPVSLYAATKKSNELMAHSYSHLFGINSTGLRFFTVYGPWGRPDMAMFSFTKAIIEEKEIKVFNSGNLSRDFTYIDDIVEGIMSLINNIEKDKYEPIQNNNNSKAGYYEIVNIGNNHPEKLMDFIHLLEDSIVKKAIIKYMPMQQGDVFTTYADIDKISSMSSFKPKTKLNEGIVKFVEWYKYYYLQVNQN